MEQKLNKLQCILQNGNTPLLRAIENGVDTGTIHWLITVRGVYSLFDRNKDGLTARELAYLRGRDNTVKMIDRVSTLYALNRLAILREVRQFFFENVNILRAKN